MFVPACYLLLLRCPAVANPTVSFAANPARRRDSPNPRPNPRLRRRSGRRSSYGEGIKTRADGAEQDMNDTPQKKATCTLYTPGHRVSCEEVLKIYLKAKRIPLTASLDEGSGEGWFAVTVEGRLEKYWTHDEEHLLLILQRSGGELAIVEGTYFFVEYAHPKPGKPCAWITASREATPCETKTSQPQEQQTQAQ